MTRNTTTIILAGGGSGGHIAPGIAIAEALREIDPAARVLFICSQRSIDAMMLGEAGERFETLAAQPFSAHPLRLLRFYRTFRASRKSAKEMLKREGAACVAALGGFVAAPVMAAAKDLKLPRVLINLDDPPGKANRMMALMGPRVVSAIDVSIKSFKHERVGFPIRRRTIAPADAVECRKRLGLAPDLPLLLVTGASQGASSINQLMIALAEQSAASFRGWQVLHLCGEESSSAQRSVSPSLLGRGSGGGSSADRNHARPSNNDTSPTPQPPPSQGRGVGDATSVPGGVKAQLEHAYASAGITATVQAFSHEMGLAWGAAEVAVSRAGANSVAEVAMNAVPTVFLPYPYHKDQHQRRNAEPLEKLGGAVIVKDTIDALQNLEHAGNAIIELLTNEPRRRAMRQALHANRPTNASKDIASMLLKMCG